VLLRQEAQLGTVVLAWKAPHGLHEDADALALLALALGTGKSSRLYRALVDTGLGVFSGASFPRLHDPGLFVAYAQPAPGHAHAAIEAALLDAVGTLARDGVSDAEMARVQGLLRAHEDRAARVTAEDLQRVARTYLHEDALTVGWHVTEVRGAGSEVREERSEGHIE
jgi:zinc protease